MSLVAEGFFSQARATSIGLGLPNIACALIPGHPGVQSEAVLRANLLAVTLDKVIEGLTKTAAAAGAGAEPDPTVPVYRGDFTSINALYIEKEWSDGLPIVPPTRDRIEAFLRHTHRSADDTLGVLLPDNRAATIWSIAVNGVMAGCRPEYMPILVALVEAMADPVYGVEHSGNTPGSDTLIILNGPITKTLGFNYTQGVMRDGFQANTSIGRFWRLYLRNVAGFLPNKTDKATFGNTWRVVVPENEDVLAELGWPSIAVDQGFKSTDDTVTISRYAGGGVSSSVSGSTPEEILPYIADALVRQHSWHLTFVMGVGYGTIRPLAMMSPIVARTIAQAGWSKRDVQQFFFEHARMKAWEMERMLRDWGGKPIWNLTEEAAKGNIPRDVYACSEDPDRLVPIAWQPEHFMLAVTGDPLRPSAYAFGHNGQLGFPVTKKIVTTPR